MAQRRPTVRWSKQRWMAWVRFPDGSRHKVERVAKGDAEADLDDLLASRAAKQSPDARRERLVTFNEVLDTWTDAGCPNVATNRRRARPKAENTIHTISYLLDGHVRPKIGNLRVERTPTDTVEQVFHQMAEAGYASSTIDHAWVYLNQACLYGLRHGLIKTSPAGDVLLPAARPARKRRSLSIDQARTLLFTAIPADPRPAQSITALLCGLRPGEITSLRWAFVDIDSDDPKIVIDERANEVAKEHVGQADPKTHRKAGIGLHPIVVAALRRHRSEMEMLGLYDPEGFAFCTRNGTPQLVGNLRRSFKRLGERAGLPGEAWTTYELRHSFVSLVSEMTDDLTKVADLAGHTNTRTTEGYRHAVVAALPHAIKAWDQVLANADMPAGQMAKAS